MSSLLEVASMNNIFCQGLGQSGFLEEIKGLAKFGRFLLMFYGVQQRCWEVAILCA